MSRRYFGRRRILRLSLLAPLAGIVAACSGAVRPVPAAQPAPPRSAPDPSDPPQAPVPVPEPPFVVAAGDEKRLLMASTPYETSLYIRGSGNPGKIILVLGGVHGNEPAGWLAAERVVDRLRPANGALLVVPHANKIADNIFERTTPQIGDLNRSYPGFTDGLPMERMAAQLCDVIREFQVNVVHDMHESWAFYKDRTVNGTAFLGQTVATNPVDPGLSLVRSVVEAVNRTVLYSQEEFSVRQFPPGGQPGQSLADQNLPRQAQTPPGGRGTSSLGLSQFFPGLVPVLVEMGQQQALERRIALHVQVLEEVLRQTGVLAV
jgi:hypothetical protein